MEQVACVASAVAASHTRQVAAAAAAALGCTPHYSAVVCIRLDKHPRVLVLVLVLVLDRRHSIAVVVAVAAAVAADSLVAAQYSLAAEDIPLGYIVVVEEAEDRHRSSAHMEVGFLLIREQ